MLASILVATPHVPFGELLRISLEDSGQYQVRLAQSAKEARAAMGRASFQLAILDAALKDEQFVRLCMDLLEQQPAIRLVVIPPDNNPSHPALGGLIPHGYLSRPFYLPDLLDTVSRLLSEREKQIRAQSLPDREPVPASLPSMTLPLWLQEPITLRGYLEKELAKTQALAALTGMNGPLPGSGGQVTGSLLRACAGSLSEDAAQELAGIIFRYWNRSEKTDLMRFVRLSADKRDYLVYTTLIVGDLVLILVYDNSVPLSQIRPQAKAMAQVLASLPPSDFHAGRKVLEDANPPAGQSSPAEGTPPGGLPGAAPTGDSQTTPIIENRFIDRAASSFAPPDEPKPTSGAPAADRPVVEPPPAVNPLVSTPGGAGSLPAVEHPVDRLPDEQDEDEDGVGGDASSQIINLTALLGAVPAPNPENEPRPGTPLNGGWMPERSAGAPIPTLPGGLNGGWELNGERERGSAPAEKGEGNPPLTQHKRKPMTAPLDPSTLTEELPASPSLPVDYALPAQPSSGPRPASLEVKTEPPVNPSGMPVEPRSTAPIPPLAIEPESSLNPVEETRPTVISSITSLGQLEPASPALSLLNYTCVLVPRLPQHYLTGELADRLAVWVQQLCLAFGWRLEGIAIRPEYLQWTVQVAPAISPGNLVRIVRQRTSMHIFGTFTHLADQNPSGDFWATGYLIVSGAQPPSAQLLRDYIVQTRKRQGISK